MSPLHANDAPETRIVESEYRQVSVPPAISSPLFEAVYITNQLGTYKGVDPLSSHNITRMAGSAAALTARVAEQTAAESASDSEYEVVEVPQSDAERLSAQRMEALSRRYVAKEISRELEARLIILNERLNALLPPATDGELQTLEDIARARAERAKKLAEIRTRLKLG